MAHLHYRITKYKSGGARASRRLEYITRLPAEALSRGERQIRYTQGDREDLVYANTRNLPAWARQNPYVFFQAAERYERANGVAFEEWKITLPQEFSHRDNMALTRDLVELIAGDALPITYAFHDPRTLDGLQQQPHLHLLISARQNDGVARSPAQHFRRYNPQHPARGGARKDPAFHQFGAVKAHRVLIADVINGHLERAGCEARVHPETLERRGIARRPEPKLLPSESREYREDGTVNPRMQEVLDVRTTRKHTRAQEYENARTYWEERKVTLGITDAMDVPAQLAVIGAARVQTRDQTPARQVILGEVGMEQDDRLLGDRAGEAYAQAQHEARDVWEDVQAEQEMLDDGWSAVQTARADGHVVLAAALGEQQAQEQARTWQSLEQDLLALAAQLDALSEESGGRGTVRIRLWERDQGLGF